MKRREQQTADDCYSMVIDCATERFDGDTPPAVFLNVAAQLAPEMVKALREMEILARAYMHTLGHTLSPAAPALLDAQAKIKNTQQILEEVTP